MVRRPTNASALRLRLGRFAVVLGLCGGLRRREYERDLPRSFSRCDDRERTRIALSRPDDHDPVLGIAAIAQRREPGQEFLAIALQEQIERLASEMALRQVQRPGRGRVALDDDAARVDEHVWQRGEIEEQARATRGDLDVTL